MRLLGSLREGNGGGGGMSSSNSKTQGQDCSICCVVSMEELSKFQRRNPDADIFLRAGLFGGATLSIDPTNQSSNSLVAAGSFGNPGDSFAKHQLPFSLWKEIISTFRHPHGSSFQDYHNQSHGDDGSAGLFQYVSTYLSF